jgi:hypothetical protein
MVWFVCQVISSSWLSSRSSSSSDLRSVRSSVSVEVASLDLIEFTWARLLRCLRISVHVKSGPSRKLCLGMRLFIVVEEWSTSSL